MLVIFYFMHGRRIHDVGAPVYKCCISSFSTANMLTRDDFINCLPVLSNIECRGDRQNLNDEYKTAVGSMHGNFTPAGTFRQMCDTSRLAIPMVSEHSVEALTALPVADVQAVYQAFDKVYKKQHLCKDAERWVIHILATIHSLRDRDIRNLWSSQCIRCCKPIRAGVKGGVSGHLFYN